MVHIKQRVPPEQPAGLLQFTREEERDGEALNLVVVGSEEERGRRWGNSHEGKGRKLEEKSRGEMGWVLGCGCLAAGVPFPCLAFSSLSVSSVCLFV